MAKEIQNVHLQIHILYNSYRVCYCICYLMFSFCIGWAMQIAGYIFLDRKWDEDQENISKCLRVFKETEYKPQVGQTDI